MAETIAPTKGNLITAKRSLSLARLGYDLLDRKRNILIHEMMSLIDAAEKVQSQIDDVFSQAYLALQRANITLGVIEGIAQGVPVDTSLCINFKSVMGVEIPSVSIYEEPPKPYYGFADSNSMLDEAFISFLKVKRLTATLAEIEISVYRLANAIKKTQRRANALKNIIIPKFEFSVKFISDALEEKEREDFSRLKVIRMTKDKKQDIELGVSI
jgi:V/A-type H+-transporting ATPase subunit D